MPTVSGGERLLRPVRDPMRTSSKRWRRATEAHGERQTDVVLRPALRRRGVERQAARIGVAMCRLLGDRPCGNINCDLVRSA